jgi:hypothetical protein
VTSREGVVLLLGLDGKLTRVDRKRNACPTTWHKNIHFVAKAYTKASFSNKWFLTDAYPNTQGDSGGVTATYGAHF